MWVGCWQVALFVHKLKGKIVHKNQTQNFDCNKTISCTYIKSKIKAT